ncbi:MOSC domain-containing protein [Planktotalea sp.]|uniref:MOSC domain-containing protein n=1 Tax=Planktotalea sp. TaxID=2029877 RepID=UPI0025E81030|nr:MOSC domain-containing protein [Planktotalea sp.]
MPALKPTDYFATVLWLGSVKDSEADLRSDSTGDMPLTFAGYAAEFHAGLTRPSCSRVKQQYPRYTEIKNTRQLSIVSQEELDFIAADIGLETLAPHLIGASVVIEGIQDWSHVPPSSRLVSEGGPGLIIDMENRPCHLPAPFIEVENPGLGKSFKTAAKGRRGVTASVEQEGVLQIGMRLRLHIPDQPNWAMID